MLSGGKFNTMEITIKATEKEIADLINRLQSQRNIDSRKLSELTNEVCDKVKATTLRERQEIIH